MEETTHTRGWSRRFWVFLLATLTLLTFVTHGYHPLAEDGGLYVAGVEWQLSPSLFPHYTAFVTEHLRFSVFAPVLAFAVHALHLPLPWLLLLSYLASTGATLFAAREILRRCELPDAAQLGGIALLATWWTMPIAGTSLMLTDPYVTGRSFSTPLSLLALAWALDDWNTSRSAYLCAVAILLTAAFHPLMAVYALGMVVTLRLGRTRQPIFAWTCLGAIALLAASILQSAARPESTAEAAAAYSRYYWFLSQWQWYELLGLVGPLVILLVLARVRGEQSGRKIAEVVRSACILSVIAIIVALLFAHESYRAHAVARLQPLRVYLQIYALMAMLLGAEITRRCLTGPKRLLPIALLLASAVGMFAVQRMTFPASQHLELPWRAATNPNPWVQAFLWAQQHTPNDALFALDAKYVNTKGEDAQTFRAIAQRSTLPDFSKDGGEAAITPALAELWQQGARAQNDLSQLDDTERDARLRPLGVTWMVLHAQAATAHACPYRNDVVKVCELPR